MTGHRRLAIPAVLAVVVLTAALAAAPALGAQAPADFVNGSGRASAQVVRIGPSIAGLSAAPTLGVALADYTGTVGRGEAQAVNWAALEVSLPPEVVNAVPPLRVTSTDAGAAAGKTASLGLPLAAGTGAGVTVQEASATSAPLGRAAVSVAGLQIPGLLGAAAGRAEASSGVVDGAARESRAVAEIASLSLAGGLVTLGGLRWVAVQRTGAGGAVEVAEGSFTVGAIEVAGVPLVPGDVTATLLGTVGGVLDTALAPTGLQIVMPREVVENGVVRITPLAIHYEATETTKGLLAPILGLLDPVRQPLTTAIIDVLTSLAGEDGLPLGLDPGTLGLTADVIVGLLSGSSSFDLELGGASAFTEGEALEGFDLFGAGFDLGAPGVAANSSAEVSEAGAPASTPVPAVVAGVTVPADDSSGDGVTAAAPIPRSAVDALRRSLASAAWAAGLIAILGATAWVARDWRRPPAALARAGRGRPHPIT